MHPNLRPALHAAAALLVAASLSCTARDRIWNGGDLEKWVREQAVGQGYRAESLRLEDWYRTEDGRMVWHGRGIRAGDSTESRFAIPVDKVWKPSSGTAP